MLTLDAPFDGDLGDLRYLASEGLSADSVISSHSTSESAASMAELLESNGVGASYFSLAPDGSALDY